MLIVERRSSVRIVDLLISLLIWLAFALCNLKFCCRVHTCLELCGLLRGWTPLSLHNAPFITNAIAFSEVYFTLRLMWQYHCSLGRCLHGILLSFFLPIFISISKIDFLWMTESHLTVLSTLLIIIYITFSLAMNDGSHGPVSSPAFCNILCFFTCSICFWFPAVFLWYSLLHSVLGDWIFTFLLCCTKGTSPALISSKDFYQSKVGPGKETEPPEVSLTHVCTDRQTDRSITGLWLCKFPGLVHWSRGGYFSCFWKWLEWTKEIGRKNGHLHGWVICWLLFLLSKLI